jgi:hypothetical protein
VSDTHTRGCRLGRLTPKVSARILFQATFAPCVVMLPRVAGFPSRSARERWRSGRLIMRSKKMSWQISFIIGIALGILGVLAYVWWHVRDMWR